MANMAIIRLGSGGAVDVVARGGTGGTVDVVLDVVGYFGSTTAPGATAAGQISLLSQPQRLVDTRPGTGYQGQGQPLQGLTTPRCFTVGGQAGVPATAVGVLANVTTTNDTTSGHPAGGHLTVWPAGQALPATSNLNYAPWQHAIANMAVLRLGTGGTSGQVCAIGQPGVDLVLDVVGYLAPGGTGGTVSLLSGPLRLVDTRAGSGYQGAATSLEGLGTPSRFMVAGRSGVPADAVGVLANVTTTTLTAAAHLTVWPSGQATPATSNLNYSPAEGAIANMAVVRLGTVSAGGSFGSTGSVDVIGWPGVDAIIDVVGYIK